MARQTPYNVEEQTIKYLTKDELRRFFSRIKDKRDRTMFAAIYYFGLRVSEATLITLEDVDFERDRIYIRRVKGGISGEKTLKGDYRDVRRLVKSYIEHDRQPTGMNLFTGRKGDLRENRIRQLFYTYAKKVRLKGYSVHCLRHSRAVHLIEDGAGIEYVQDLLGHRNIQNTMVYARVTHQRREEVAERLARNPRRFSM